MTTDISPELKNNGDIKKSINASIWIGAILILLGITAIALPNFSTIVAETWIALILTSAGSAKLVYAFQNRNGESGSIWKLLLSILYIATGVMLFVYPLTGVLSCSTFNLL